jgi:adenosylhomocysteine nucleosidase
MKMKVLVTFAVEGELAPWRKRHGFVRREITSGSQSAGFACSGQIGNSTVDVFLTGIGCTGGTPALRALLAEKPDVLISSGFAGGLKTSLKCGEIVVAKRVSNLDGRAQAACDPGLVRAAEECGATPAAFFLTSRQLVSHSTSKREMGRFGDAVEMESFHILAMATGSQVPAVAVRAISDTVDEDLPLDFSRVVNKDGRISSRQLALQLARYPHRLPALFRFGRRSRRTAQGLGDFLDRYLGILGKDPGQWAAERLEEVAAT